MKALSLFLAVTLVLPVSGCTTWGQKKTVGETYEVSRMVVGAPYTERRTSVSAGFEHDRHGMAAGVDHVEREHCLQQVEIVYAEPFELRPAPRRRWLDIMGGAIVAAVGLSTVAFTSLVEDIDADGFNDDGRSDHAPGYIFGGLAIAGGLGWIVASVVALPAGDPPPVEHSAKRWTVLEEIESDECAVIVPIELDPALLDAQTIEDRLIRLEALRDSGTITEDEYHERRRAIVEEL